MLRTALGPYASSLCLPSARVIGVQRHLQILTSIIKLKNLLSREWRDGPVTKSIHCSVRGLWFSSQYPHSRTQLTPLSGHLMPSSDIHRGCTHTLHRRTCRQNTCTYKKLHFEHKNNFFSVSSSHVLLNGKTEVFLKFKQQIIK